MKLTYRGRAARAGLRVVATLSYAAARVTPLRCLGLIGDGLVWALEVVVPRRRRLAEANIAASFPQMSAPECRAIAHRSFRNTARTILELFKLPGMAPQEAVALVEGFDPEAVRSALRQGRGVLIVSAHFGNWELAGLCMAHSVGPLAVVAHTDQRNLAASLMNAARARLGITVLAPTDTRAMARLLSSGGMVAVLPDQRPRQGGVVMDFLGRPAATYTGPAQLASLCEARVFACFCRRVSGVRFAMQVWEIPMAASGNREADVLENTRRINGAIEQAIREAPDNWMWLHNRWKKPKAQVLT